MGIEAGVIVARGRRDSAVWREGIEGNKLSHPTPLLRFGYVEDANERGGVDPDVRRRAAYGVDIDL